MEYLVVGGSAVSGQMIQKAIREHEPKAVITATTSGIDRPVPGADRTIFNVSLDSPQAAETIVKEWKGGSPEVIAYVPARGAVGMPTSRATREMVGESIDYCIRPMLRLTQKLRSRKTVCLSGFITMEPMLQCYGAMAYSKLIMEDLVVRHPDRLQTIRLGMFMSKSVRGIAILTQKNLMREVYPELASMAAEWRASGKKFSDFFYDKNWHFEETKYKNAAPFTKPFRPTTEDDIRLAMLRILRGEKEPILNVLGDWVWTDRTMPPLPEIVKAHPEFMQWDLEKYFAEA